MKRISISLAIIVCWLSSSLLVSAQQGVPHLTAEIVELGKVPSRTQLAGAQGEKYDSHFVMSLNGEWDFWWSVSDADYKDEYVSEKFNSSEWEHISVPANWELNGYGTAIYTNHGYEFKPYKPQPPFLPEKNAVGVYRKTITIPSDWKEREVKQTHISDITPREFTEVCIDAQMTGVGGDNSWGAQTYEKYKVHTSTPQSLTFKIIPY